MTAANASGICDGAGSIILASEDAVKEYGLTPLARLASYHVSGCEPSIMGIGPVPAIKGALASAGLSLANVDRVEINEAFAAQFLACAKELELDMSKTNLHDGAICSWISAAETGSPTFSGALATWNVIARLPFSARCAETLGWSSTDPQRQDHHACYYLSFFPWLLPSFSTSATPCQRCLLRS